MDVIKLAGELELVSAGEEESDSDSEEPVEECCHEDNSAQGDVILLAFHMLKEHQQGDPDCQSLAQWGSATATPTRDELQASSTYIGVLSQHLDRIAEVDQMLVLPEEVDGTKRVIVPTSLIGEVIDDANQRPGTAHGCVKKVLERLVHSYYWPE